MESIDKRLRIKYETIDRIKEQIKDLQKIKFQYQLKISKKEKTKQDKCKHDGEIYRIKNCRDDASFAYWIFCKKCKKDIGCQEFDGTIRRWKYG